MSIEPSFGDIHERNNAARFCERVNLIRENELGKLPVLN